MAHSLEVKILYALDRGQGGPSHVPGHQGIDRNNLYEVFGDSDAPTALMPSFTGIKFRRPAVDSSIVELANKFFANFPF